MCKHKVIIVGAGLSGLYTAWLLQRAGVNCLLLEGRMDTDGRILSLPVACSRVDLGATWVWPSVQPQLMAQLDQLNIPLIELNEYGGMLHERSAYHQAAHYAGYTYATTLMLVKGGLRVLTEMLEHQLSSDTVITNRRIQQIQLNDTDIQIKAHNHANEIYHFKANTVLMDARRHAVTWLAPHAKYIAAYRTHFWQHNGLSGMARCEIGPMVEIHDAWIDNGINALFGYFGITAHARHTKDEATLIALCRAQLVRLFGRQANYPVAEFYKTWSSDPFTATASDSQLQPGHQNSPPCTASNVWANRIIDIASEWSSSFPVYVAGAIEAADFCVLNYLANRQRILSKGENSANLPSHTSC